MTKRSTKTKRREPVRHPIPAAKLRADRSAVDRGAVAVEQLLDGEPVQPGVRVRLARPDDLPALQVLTALAGVPFEDEIAAAIEAGHAGAALLAGVRGGQEAFQRHLLEQWIDHQADDQRVPFLHATAVMVADHEQHGTVGGVVAYPPVAVMRQMVQQAAPMGADPGSIVLGGAIGLVRVKALAVAESMRGNGIGGALLQRCRQLYGTCGYMIMYGQMPPSPGLDDFYRAHGFDVLEQGVGFDPWVIFGVHADIHPEPHERVFITDELSTRRSH